MKDEQDNQSGNHPEISSSVLHSCPLAAVLFIYAVYTCIFPMQQQAHVWKWTSSRLCCRHLLSSVWIALFGRSWHRAIHIQTNIISIFNGWALNFWNSWRERRMIPETNALGKMLPFRVLLEVVLENTTNSLAKGWLRFQFRKFCTGWWFWIRGETSKATRLMVFKGNENRPHYKFCWHKQSLERRWAVKCSAN